MKHRGGIAAVAACAAMAGHAGADELRTGIYALRTVPGEQLDSREVYIVADRHGVTGFFDNPFTTPASNNPDRDPTAVF